MEQKFAKTGHIHSIAHRLALFTIAVCLPFAFSPANAFANLRDLKTTSTSTTTTTTVERSQTLAKKPSGGGGGNTTTTSITLSPTSLSIAASGGTGSLTLKTSKNTKWKVSSPESWIALNPTSGQGNKTISYSVAANSQSVSRTGSIELYDANNVLKQVVSVSQAPAAAVIVQYSFSPTSASFGSTGGNSSVQLTAPSTGSWTIETTSPWISNISPSSGVGSATINYSVAANANCDARTNALVVLDQNRVAQKSFVVSQSGGSGNYSVSVTGVSASSAGGDNSIYLTTGTGCAWRAQADAGWVSITSATTGSGSAQINFTIAGNSSCTARSTTIRILDGNSAVRQTVTVSQAGSTAAYSLSSTYMILTSTGGNINVGLTANCAWTAQSDSAWISNVSPASGTGNATIYFSILANSDCPSRNGTIKIFDGSGALRQTLAITQSGNPTTYTLSTTVANFASIGGTSVVSVAASAPGCIWTVSNTNNWIQVSPMSAVGSASVTVTASQNVSTSPRAGTVLIAGVAYSVTQDGTDCTFSIIPTSRNHGAGLETGSVTVSANSSDCPWTATSSASWLTITSGASGVGNGTVNYSVGSSRVDLQACKLEYSIVSPK